MWPLGPIFAGPARSTDNAQFSNKTKLIYSIWAGLTSNDVSTGSVARVKTASMMVSVNLRLMTVRQMAAIGVEKGVGRGVATRHNDCKKKSHDGELASVLLVRDLVCEEWVPIFEQVSPV